MSSIRVSAARPGRRSAAGLALLLALMLFPAGVPPRGQAAERRPDRVSGRDRGFTREVRSRLSAPGATGGEVPLYALWERAVINTATYANPFDHAEIELRATFTSPSGRTVEFWGFHDGDGQGGQSGNVWKQRFMCDEPGAWTYALRWAGSGELPTGTSGEFNCVIPGARPGPWRVDAANHRWLRTARGDPFLPRMVHAIAMIAPVDWQDAIAFARARGFNTLVTPAINPRLWGEGWPNPTPFATVDAGSRTVDYTRFNMAAWSDWDRMLQAAGDAELYIGPFDGPAGDYGGQSGAGTVYPPDGLQYEPARNTRFDTAVNLSLIRYMVARQAAYWNLAYWCLYATEVFEIKGRDEVIAYGEHLAAMTPFGRMITAQDIEQVTSAGDLDWLARMDIDVERKLNSVQTGAPDDSRYQQAGPNNSEALQWVNRGFPVLLSEALWEGQPRAGRPLSMIWGNLTAGAHLVWADWRYDDGVDGGRWGSIGRGFTPLKPLSERLFRTTQLGIDTVGDEQIVIALHALEDLEYWRMEGHNDLLRGGAEAYVLAEPGEQYLVYAPDGGTLFLDLGLQAAVFDIWWLDPRNGAILPRPAVPAGGAVSFSAPGTGDWVLFAVRRGGGRR